MRRIQRVGPALAKGGPLFARYIYMVHRMDLSCNLHSRWRIKHASLGPFKQDTIDSARLAELIAWYGRAFSIYIVTEIHWLEEYFHGLQECYKTINCFTR